MAKTLFHNLHFVLPPKKQKSANYKLPFISFLPIQNNTLLLTKTGSEIKLFCSQKCSKCSKKCSQFSLKNSEQMFAIYTPKSAQVLRSLRYTNWVKSMQKASRNSTPLPGTITAQELQSLPGFLLFSVAKM